MKYEYVDGVMIPVEHLRRDRVQMQNRRAIKWLLGFVVVWAVLVGVGF